MNSLCEDSNHLQTPKSKDNTAHILMETHTKTCFQNYFLKEEIKVYPQLRTNHVKSVFYWMEGRENEEKRKERKGEGGLCFKIFYKAEMG